jgi:hypothetical protein
MMVFLLASVRRLVLRFFALSRCSCFTPSEAKDEVDDCSVLNGGAYLDVKLLRVSQLRSLSTV